MSDGFYGCDQHQPCTPIACPECVEMLLKNLLAVIHRDGGHHTEWVGLRQSISDAESEVVRLTRERDSALSRLAAAEKVVEAAWVVTVEANLKTLAHLDTALNAYDAIVEYIKDGAR